MLIDDITALAIDLGIPTRGLTCSATQSIAGKILAVIETLLLIDHEPGELLGARFRFARDTANHG